MALPERFDLELQSWDMTFKDTADADFVVGQAWGRCHADCFLLDQVRDRMDFPRTVAAFHAFCEKWPRIHLKLVEDKANGPAVIAEVRRRIPGVVPVEPSGGKVSRVNAVAPTVESGNVYLPHPSIAPWVDGFVLEATGFPNAAHDDQVDAMSQALVRLMALGGGMKTARGLQEGFHGGGGTVLGNFGR